jgi:hypothetical protein
MRFSLDLKIKRDKIRKKMTHVFLSVKFNYIYNVNNVCFDNF